MKNQYFGDSRDFFKYDLALELLGSLPRLERFTFVPLLTPDDGSGDGRFKSYPCGARRRELHAFLRETVAAGRLDVRTLRDFFAARPFAYEPYGETTYFTHASRRTYLAGIPGASLRRALVVFDPDNGLEPRRLTNGNGHRYLRDAEVGEVLGRCDGASVVLVFQFLPRRPRGPVFAELAARLRSATGLTEIAYLTDNVVAFFVLTKRRDRSRMDDVLAAYARRVGARADVVRISAASSRGSTRSRSAR